MLPLNVVQLACHNNTIPCAVYHLRLRLVDSELFCIQRRCCGCGCGKCCGEFCVWCCTLLCGVCIVINCLICIINNRVKLYPKAMRRSIKPPLPPIHTYTLFNTLASFVWRVSRLLRGSCVRVNASTTTKLPPRVVKNCRQLQLLLSGHMADTSNDSCRICSHFYFDFLFFLFFFPTHQRFLRARIRFVPGSVAS